VLILSLSVMVSRRGCLMVELDSKAAYALTEVFTGAAGQVYDLDLSQSSA
jgi:hypothetical protein